MLCGMWAKTNFITIPKNSYTNINTMYKMPLGCLLLLE